MTITSVLFIGIPGFKHIFRNQAKLFQFIAGSHFNWRLFTKCIDFIPLFTWGICTLFCHRPIGALGIKFHCVKTSTNARRVKIVWRYLIITQGAAKGEPAETVLTQPNLIIAAVYVRNSVSAAISWRHNTSANVCISRESSFITILY